MILQGLNSSYLLIDICTATSIGLRCTICNALKTCVKQQSSSMHCCCWKCRNETCLAVICKQPKDFSHAGRPGQQSCFLMSIITLKSQGGISTTGMATEGGQIPSIRVREPLGCWSLQLSAIVNCKKVQNISKHVA